MKISIVTNSYYPFQNPRAFRSVELAEEFARQGHEVIVYNCSFVKDYSYKSLNTDKIKIINVNTDKLSAEKNTSGNIRNKKNIHIISRILKDFLFYFTTNKYLILFVSLDKKLKFEGRSDMLISIGLPFHIHWAVSRKIKGKNIADVYVADYGDPFSKHNPTIKVAPYFRFIEKKIIKKFDYITTPTLESVSSYLWLKPKEKIKVIPQGFRINFIPAEKYKKNSIPTFAFAGRFYSSIRNPKAFFEYLIGLDVEFLFYIYAGGEGESGVLIKDYLKILGDKVVVHDSIPRTELLKELMKMDFLVNMDNVNANQTPSKLIDYALTQRPIFSFSQDEFDLENFHKFLSGDYSGAKAIDLTSYDIRGVANKFLSLAK